MAPPSRRRVAFLMGVLLGLGIVSYAEAASDSANGNGSSRVKSYIEVTTTDGTIAAFDAAPSSSDPGPRVYSNSDYLRFNGGYTNTRHVLLLDVSSATDGGGSSTETVQGTAHTIADWVHVRQGGATNFGTVQAVGVYDAAAGSYVAPGGFTKDSQGTLVLRTYGQTGLPDGGTTTTLYWIYDATENKYWFDRTDQDFTNGNGEEVAYPLSHKSEKDHTFVNLGLGYGVPSVAGAGGNYVPTVEMGWNDLPGQSGGNDFDAYALVDFPSGTPEDSYSFTVRATISKTK